MSDEHSDKPDPIEDVRKGLGLLFRAAKGAIESLPTKRVEDVVLTGAREVGRALENVSEVIDRQILKRPPGSTKPMPETDGVDGEPKAEQPPPKDDEPKGPRVG
jgi:hypothetical protein